MAYTMDHRWTDDSSFDTVFLGCSDDGFLHIAVDVRCIKGENLSDIFGRHVIIDFGGLVASSRRHVGHDSRAGDVYECSVLAAICDASDEGDGAGDVVCRCEIFAVCE